MANYILRNADDKLWASVKARAEKEGRPLRFIILTLLAEYVKHGLRGK